VSGLSNAETVREGFRAFSEGRYQDCLDTLDPDIEWHVAFQIPDLPQGSSVMRGHDEVLELWRLFGSVWGRLEFIPQDFLHDSGGTVIARTRLHATGGESGVNLDATLYYLMHIRDGLLHRIQPFDTAEEAAAAAGIDPAELRSEPGSGG
jgi:ketosteroid isomerase-like protein